MRTRGSDRTVTLPTKTTRPPLTTRRTTGHGMGAMVIERASTLGADAGRSHACDGSADACDQGRSLLRDVGPDAAERAGVRLDRDGVLSSLRRLGAHAGPPRHQVGLRHALRSQDEGVQMLAADGARLVAQLDQRQLGTCGDEATTEGTDLTSRGADAGRQGEHDRAERGVGGEAVDDLPNGGARSRLPAPPEGVMGEERKNVGGRMCYGGHVLEAKAHPPTPICGVGFRVSGLGVQVRSFGQKRSALAGGMVVCVEELASERAKKSGAPSGG